MTKALAALVAVLALTVAGLVAYMATDGGHEAEANSPINCSLATDSSTSPPTLTVTCTGTISVDTPIGEQTLSFSLIVTADDNPPSGPSFGDDITSCTLDVNGNGPQSINFGPCP